MWYHLKIGVLFSSQMLRVSTFSLRYFPCPPQLTITMLSLSSKKLPGMVHLMFTHLHCSPALFQARSHHLLSFNSSQPGSISYMHTAFQRPLECQGLFECLKYPNLIRFLIFYVMLSQCYAPLPQISDFARTLPH